MNILITGGAGFIGSHVADAYIAEGHHVVILDNLSSGSTDNIPDEAQFYKMDLMDPALERVFLNEKIDVVNHHAAQISVTESVANPAFDAQINILGSLRLIELANKHKVSKFIFASTGGAIYGEQDYFPACENHPCRPLSPYGISKLTVEKYLDFFSQTFGLKFTILRYSNVYGPRQNPHGEAGVVAIFCNKLLDGQPLMVYGDGEQTRDFVCALDVAQANLHALSDSIPGIYNIGTGEETTVNQLAEILKGLVEGVDPTIHAPARAGEQRRSVIDAGKMIRDSGWTPQYSLDKGLERTLRFFENSCTQNI